MGTLRSKLVVFVFASISIQIMPSQAEAGHGSIGQYFNGCMDWETKLTGFETGLLKIYPKRERGYGNPDMIDLLTQLGVEYTQAFPAPHERIQIGDISDHWGGGLYNNHASHQNGLDVDVIYLRRNFREFEDMREDFVKSGRVTKNFDVARNWWMFRWLVATGRVERIFVAREIKQHFCRTSAFLEHSSPSERFEILRRLRPIRGHANHFHLRLLCPASDLKCVGTPPPPEDHGCGKDFKGLITDDILEEEEAPIDPDGILEPSFMSELELQDKPAPIIKKPKLAKQSKFRECRELEKKRRAERRLRLKARGLPRP